MPTTATAFAQTVKTYKNSKDLSNAVITLYRQYIRNAPNFVTMYEMNLPVALVRTKFRQEFERNRFAQDIGVRNHLLAKGHMEFQETVNFWKQGCHVLKFFDDYNAVQVEKKPEDFVRKFIKGTA